MNKILSSPKQQQSIVKKFVKKGPGEHKEIDATKDIISVFMPPFEGYCKKNYHLMIFFKILALAVAVFDPDWTPLLGHDGSTPGYGNSEICDATEWDRFSRLISYGVMADRSIKEGKLRFFQ